MFLVFLAISLCKLLFFFLFNAMKGKFVVTSNNFIPPPCMIKRCFSSTVPVLTDYNFVILLMNIWLCTDIHIQGHIYFFQNIVVLSSCWKLDVFFFLLLRLCLKISVFDSMSPYVFWIFIKFQCICSPYEWCQKNWYMYVIWLNEEMHIYYYILLIISCLK